MHKESLFIAISFGSFLFLFIVFLVSVQYFNASKHSRKSKNHQDDWLFHDFYLKIYSAVFGRMDPDEAAVKLGVNIEKYYNNCALIRKKPNPKKLIVSSLYGIAVLAFSMLLCVLVSPIFMIYGGILFFVLVYYEQQNLESKAKEMRIQVADELPRFLDLLQTELIIGMPIETAIYTICQKFDCLLSREFLEALNEMELGISGWQQALEKVAAKYGIETLSDFVLDVSTSYSKGISIADSVIRKTKEVKETHLLTVKERAGKATNEIIIPIVLFQIIPMIAFILVPTMIEITGMF